jgi:hypothetical protein
MNDYYTVKMEELTAREDEILGPMLECVGSIDILLNKVEAELLKRDLAGAAKTLADVMRSAEDILEMLSECET